MNIPRFNTYQKVILCLGALAIAIRCFAVDRYISFTEVFFHCAGIAVLAGLLVYLTGILTQTKRRLKITAIVLGIIIPLFIGLVIFIEKKRAEREFLEGQAVRQRLKKAERLKEARRQRMEKVGEQMEKEMK